ncbi:MAG: response regulator [Eubacterium sp.]|nr:response regulator [Eubacterium sp.]
MENKKSSNILPIAVIGVISVIVILVAGTFVMGNSASKDTETAVKNVSLLYLDELAERREQVVGSTFDNYLDDMGVALELLDEDDLSSPENLMLYQSKMKQLYSVEKFAFVDKEGVIYTSKGTRNDIDMYKFDYLTISEPEISIKNTEGSNKKFVIAMPVDNLPFEETNLVACFIELDMDSLLDELAMQTDDNNSTTYCNIYTTDGISLNNVILGGLASEKNLIEAIANSEIDDEYSYEEFAGHFENLEEGVISFTYEGVKVTLYYVPIEGTDWMLTYLIRESVITEEIKSISDGIVRKSFMQSVMTAMILAIMFVIMLIQMRKVAKANVEMQVAETENRMKQSELEEQLAMQEELLSQQKRQAEQDKMITALASDYRSVYYIDLDTDTGICYRNDSKAEDKIFVGNSFKYNDKFTEYANTYVDEQYLEGFLEFIKPENIRKALEMQKLITYRYLIHKDGRDTYEMLRMAGVRHKEDRTDHIIHEVGVGFTDIDEEMKSSLEKSQALSDALQVAEEASKAKTAFLSNMSHEIRTPMNAIIGLDSLALNDKTISDSTRDYLEKIDNSAKHLLGLINDILDMSRIESGRLTIKSEEFAFSKLVEQVNTIISSQCADKGLHYNCYADGEIGDYFIGDDIKLRQVLINILGNAVKFTPEGGTVDFKVTKAAEYDNKSTLKFEMKDTGIGMSKDYLPKIFETFSQEDSSAANKYGSSGLGMAITKNIVDMMNGKIEVDSEKGVGTTFTVTVTLLKSDRKDADDIAEDEIIPSDMSVLVIDDDKVAVDHAKLVLEKTGISAEVAHSGEEAVEMVKVRQARNNPYNLIIVDWKMPGMDGVETTKQIRSIIGDESAIILLTAYNWDDISAEATEAGVDSFVAKPLFSGNVLEEFKKAIKVKKKAQAGEKKKADLEGKRILMAEDVEINAEIMMEVLDMRDMLCEHAENGRIAVEMFSSSPEGYYDAILMDMRMPEMDGLEATKAIRALDREDAKKIPIIALTANAFDEDVQRSLQAGLNAHLSKPVDPALLYETLENSI